VKIALYNANPAWGGGERWFFEAAAALEARGHDVLRLGRPGTPLFERWAESALPAAAGLMVDRSAVPDVVLGNSGREVRSAMRLLPRGAETRIILRRGIDRPLRNNWFRRRSWRRLSGILVNSDATGATVRASLPWFPGDRIRRIYNPVPDPGSPKRAETSGRFRIGAVGRLVRQKGFDVLLTALASLDTDPPWDLVIAGDGALRGDLERRAGELGISSRVRFLGHVHDVPAVYAALDLLVVPSRYEGFGFVAAEGALAGLPVVASRVSSLPEVVRDGVTGRLVPPDDAAALAEAIASLARDPASARALGAAGRADAVERFDPEGIHTRLEAFLSEAATWPPVGRGG
jgi:glycosyltransferase involved in cell wall biosynthesis